jgi:hypothetical protein
MALMSLRRWLHAAAVLFAAVTACTVQAQTQAQLDYRSGKERIGAAFKADRGVCATMQGNTRELCLVQAKARQKAAQAALEFGSTGKPADEYRVLQAAAEARYAVARQRCMPLTGNARHVCIKQAKAVEAEAIADARSHRKRSEQHQEEEQERRDALYAVAARKCDALRAEAKDLCIAAARTQFGKS